MNTITKPDQLQPQISEQERERRKAAVDYARASVGLEGFKIGNAAEQHVHRFINGEIDLAAFVKGYRNGGAKER